MQVFGSRFSTGKIQTMSALARYSKGRTTLQRATLYLTRRLPYAFTTSVITLQGRQAGATLLDTDVVDLVRVTSSDERAAWELFLQRPDKTYSYTDCTSFVLMRRLGIAQAAAFDADFEREGFEVYQP